jgi:hypothetical protein
VQAGFYVDGAHLREHDAKAQADLADAERRFRSWLRKRAAVVGAGAADYGLEPDDIPDLVNLSSSSQIQTLLFGGFEAASAVEKKPLKAAAAAGAKATMVKPRVDIVRRCGLLRRCCVVLCVAWQALPGLQACMQLEDLS